MRASVRVLASAIAMVLALFCIWQSAAVLSEAFGSGPPYYGRTTNMDKWQNPLPLLIPLDLLGAAAAFALVRIARRL